MLFSARFSLSGEFTPLSYEPLHDSNRTKDKESWNKEREKVIKGKRGKDRDSKDKSKEKCIDSDKEKNDMVRSNSLGGCREGDTRLLQKQALFTGLLRREDGPPRRAHFLYTSTMHAPPQAPSHDLLTTDVTDSAQENFKKLSSIGNPSCPPAVLPPPQRSLFSTLHPLRGWLTKQQDSSKIKQLVDELLLFMSRKTEAERQTEARSGLEIDLQRDIHRDLYKETEREVGDNTGAMLDHYVGEYNEYGQREGFGRVSIPQGGTGGTVHSYVGQWYKGQMHGTGTYCFGRNKHNDADGNLVSGGDDEGNGHIHTYTGTFAHNRIKGYGKYEYEDGSRYEGQCAGRKREG